MKIVTIASAIAAASLFVSASAVASSHSTVDGGGRHHPDKAPSAERSGFVKTSSHESSKRSTKPKSGIDHRKKPKKD